MNSKKNFWFILVGVVFLALMFAYVPLAYAEESGSSLPSLPSRKDTIIGFLMIAIAGGGSTAVRIILGLSRAKREADAEMKKERDHLNSEKKETEGKLKALKEEVDKKRDANLEETMRTLEIRDRECIRLAQQLEDEQSRVARIQGERATDQSMIESLQRQLIARSQSEAKLEERIVFLQEKLDVLKPAEAVIKKAVERISSAEVSLSPPDPPPAKSHVTNE